MTQALLSLFPSARNLAWNTSTDKHDEEFRAVRKGVLARDGHACRFCGFADQGPYMQVHHVDHDHANNRPDNLVAACLHCHAVHHIGLWGDAASVVWLPEITQAEVSHLSRAMLVTTHLANAAMMAVTPVRELDGLLSLDRATQRIRDDLGRRKDIAARALGIRGARDLANGLLALSDDDYGRRSEMLGPFRIILGPSLSLPGRTGSSHDVVPGFVERWLSPGGQFEGLGPETWANALSIRGL